jgi:hypothetical protein
MMGDEFGSFGFAGRVSGFLTGLRFDAQSPPGEAQVPQTRVSLLAVARAVATVRRRANADCAHSPASPQCAETWSQKGREITWLR